MEFVYEQSMARADALRELTEHWNPNPDVEIVPLDQAFGRVSAQPVQARCSLPVVRSSKRDGIAVRSADFAQGIPDTKDWERGRDFAQADTGDDFPDEFDAVIAVEGIAYGSEGALSIIDDTLDLHPGDGVNPSGAIVREGSVVVPGHVRLTPELVTAAAVGGHAQIAVLKRPTVAFLATGSELVPWGSYPRRGQNIEANSLLVMGTLAEWGAQTRCYSLVPDDEGILDQALDRALSCSDIVIINGGSSRGEEDFNSTLLKRRGTYFRHGVRAVPGRPVGRAIINGTPVINVPGPVLAASLCMDWLIRGLVAHYYNVPMPVHRSVRARLLEDMPKLAPFERIVRVALEPDGEGYACRSIPLALGVPAVLTESDGVVTLPIGSAGAQRGDMVEVRLLRPLELARASWAGARQSDGAR